MQSYTPASSATPWPRAAVAGDAPAVGRAMAAAFDDDPMMRWLFPDEAGRTDGLGRYFATLFARQYQPYGFCEVTGDGAGASFWVPPRAREKAVPDQETIGALTDILGPRAARLRAGVELAAAHTPERPHWYLALLGADPTVRGRGHGAALLRSGLTQADAEGAPAYLESSKEANLAFYAHFGFTETGRVQLPDGGPTLWQMWREPATGGSRV
ncbi:GNAT family N-acetyltransferase [Streptomyces sp. NPDC003027]